MALAQVMSTVLDFVIANHIKSRAALVLEGDSILPALAVQPSYDGNAADGQVRAVFIYEDDEQQIAQNYLVREGEEQAGRARLSWCYSEWLRREAERLGIPTVAARPWDTVLNRVIAALDS